MAFRVMMLNQISTWLSQEAQDLAGGDVQGERPLQHCHEFVVFDGARPTRLAFVVQAHQALGSEALTPLADRLAAARADQRPEYLAGTLADDREQREAPRRGALDVAVGVDPYLCAPPNHLDPVHLHRRERG